MITRLLGALFLTAAACVSLPVNKEAQQPTESNTQAGNADSFVLQPRPERHPQTDKPQRSTNDDAVSWYFAGWFAPSSLPDWLMLLITAGAVGVGWRTLGVLRDQARAAADNAAAAKMNAEVAERTLLISQRGWAITSNFSIQDFAENHAARVSFRIFNAGAIPIRFTGADTHLRIDRDLPDNPNYGERTAFPDPTAVVGPGQHVTLSQDPRVITPTEFQQIASGHLQLFAYGRIFYTDIFGEHHTGYAVVWAPDLLTFRHVPSKSKYTYSD